jgi:hypothetical protein
VPVSSGSTTGPFGETNTCSSAPGSPLTVPLSGTELALLPPVQVRLLMLRDRC